RALVAAVLRAALAPASGGDVELAPDDRLDAGLLGREVSRSPRRGCRGPSARWRGSAGLSPVGRASRAAPRRRGGCTRSGRGGGRIRYVAWIILEPLKRRLGRRTDSPPTPIRWWTWDAPRCRRPPD